MDQCWNCDKNLFFVVNFTLKYKSFPNFQKIVILFEDFSWTNSDLNNRSQPKILHISSALFWYITHLYALCQYWIIRVLVKSIVKTGFRALSKKRFNIFTFWLQIWNQRVILHKNWLCLDRNTIVFYDFFKVRLYEYSCDLMQ